VSPASRALEDLEHRGLVALSTDRDALSAQLDAGPVRVYCGFDPTAPSLHMGNLLQILVLRRLQLGGHQPIGIVGGATGLIGDPKESGERRLNPVAVVAEWSERLRGQLERFLDFEGPAGAVIANNYDWTRSLSTVEFLRDIGKHFPVNRMLDREAVRARLERGGISYTEFSYVLLQAMDYLELFRRLGCTVQTGGSDQWGNITAGVELIRRVEGARVHALATPLVTKADGTKFGKTETGTLWLDPALTSPYAFYQQLLNTDDDDVVAMLNYFTFRTPAEIAALAEAVATRPRERAAQRALADDVTALVHGAAETDRVRAAAQALFGAGDLAGLDEPTLSAALRQVPCVTLAAGTELPPVAELLTATGLVSTKAAARRTVSEGGAYLNNQRLADPQAAPPPTALLHGRWLVLRRGKRHVAGVEVGSA
jgi:tyrosyl-tRNA synthetase